MRCGDKHRTASDQRQGWELGASSPHGIKHRVVGCMCVYVCVCVRVTVRSGQSWGPDSYELGVNSTELVGHLPNFGQLWPTSFDFGRVGSKWGPTFGPGSAQFSPIWSGSGQMGSNSPETLSNPAELSRIRLQIGRSLPDHGRLRAECARPTSSHNRMIPGDVETPLAHGTLTPSQDMCDLTPHLLQALAARLCMRACAGNRRNVINSETHVFVL